MSEKISLLTPGAPLVKDDKFAIARGLGNRMITASDMRAFIWIDARDYLVMDGSTDDADNWREMIAFAATYGSAVIHLPAGTTCIGSTVIVGDVVDDDYTCISIEGEGMIHTKIKWIGGTGNQAVLKYSGNKYARMAGVGFQYTGTKGSTCALEISGPDGTNGMQSNDCVFERVAFQGFHLGVCLGSLTDSAVAGADLLFHVCFFEDLNYGIFGTGDGNTLGIWLIGCSFNNIANYGADFNTAGEIYIMGGTCTAVKTMWKFQSAWATTPRIHQFRFELNPGNTEVAIEFTGGYSAEVAACTFLTTTGAAPSYNVIKGSVGRMVLNNNVFGTVVDTGSWKVCGGVDFQNGQYLWLDMNANVIFGSASKPFEIDGGNSGIDKLRYRLSGNFYSDIAHGVEEGVVVWPDRVDRVEIPRAQQYNTDTSTVDFTVTNTKVAGADECVLNLTGALGANKAITLPTAANIVAAIPGARVGMQYRLRVINSSSANFQWTVTTNTGLTLTGTMTVAQNTWREFIVTLTSLTAVAIQNIGTGTFS